MRTRAQELAASRRRRATGINVARDPGLFDEPASVKVLQIARRVLPATSSEAHRAITNSGTKAGQQRKLLDVLRGMSEPVTSFELARAAGVDRYIPGRRLSEMELAGDVRRRPARVCEVSGRNAITWTCTR